MLYALVQLLLFCLFVFKDFRKKGSCFLVRRWKFISVPFVVPILCNQQGCMRFVPRELLELGSKIKNIFWRRLI